MRVTIRDIAKLAGVSPAAVSYVLNDKPGVSSEQRDKIREIMRQTGYSPTARSRAAVPRMPVLNKRIAVIMRSEIRFIDSLFFVELNTALVRAAEEMGFEVLFSQPVAANGRAILPEFIRSGGVDGIFINGDIPLDTLFQLRETGIPVIEVDQSKKYAGQMFVTPDYEYAAYIAAEHLIRLGHSDIAFIGTSLPDYNMVTLRGFQKAVTEAGITVNLDRIFLNIEEEASLNECLASLKQSGNMPTAFLCVSDIYAAYMMQWCTGNGYRIPEDVSFIGIDDTIVARFTSPSLTAVHIDRDDIAKKALRLLTECLSGMPAHNIAIKTDELIIRGSTSAPARQGCTV